MDGLLMEGGLAAAVVVRVTILLGLAAAACLAMRRSSAATRHGVLASSAAASLVAPFLATFGPTWSLPVLTKPAEPIEAPTAPPEPVLDRREESALPVRAERRPEPGRTAIPTPILAPSLPWTWSQRLLAIWAAGAAIATIPGIVVGVRLRRLARGSQPLAGPPWDAMMDDLRGRLGVRGRVRLIQSDAVAAPITWGVFHPILALPSDAAAWPEDRLRAVLAHELAHVARRDALAQVPARLACVIYWFHPLAWWTAARMLVERERACDDLVLAAGWRGVDYAQRLLEVARGLRGRSGYAGVAAMARTSQVEDRVRAILDGSRDHRPLGRRGVLALAAATAALVVPLASARLVAQAAQAPVEAPKAETMTVSGRVVDSEGKPVAGAKVVVVGRRWELRRSKERKNELGEGVADGEGRFRIETPRTSSDWSPFPNGNVVAGAPGFGLGWRAFNVDAAAPTVEVVLPPEEPTEFRFVTPEGQPVAGLAVRMLSLTRELPPAERPGPDLVPFVGVSLSPRVPDALAGLWPGEWKTDEDGLIKVAGLGRGIMASPTIDDPRYVPDAAFFKAAPAEGSRRTRVHLSHAVRISGLVKAADDGRPIPGAIVKVTTRIGPTGSERGAKAQSDEQGRYAATIPPNASNLEVTITPPLGSPYLTRFDEFPKPSDASPQTLDLAVPRGVLIEGRVVDREGRPIDNATVTYMPTRRDKPPWGPRNVSGSMSSVSSGADGRFAIAVAPGKGTVSVTGPTRDYALREWTEANRQREYAHAFLPYDVQPGQAPVGMDAVLAPGATIVGRVDDPEGRPVARASIITAASFAGNRLSWGGPATIPVVDGRFAIPGATAGRLMKAWFFDAERGLGAMVDLDPDAGPAVVRLQPSGEARMRVVDLDGRPYASSGPRLSIVAAAGPPELHELAGIELTAEELKLPLAEEASYGLFDRRNYWPTFTKKPEADGHAVFPKLIPGATYRIYERVLEGDEATLRWRDFTVAPGQTIDLGDVRIKPVGS